MPAPRPPLTVSAARIAAAHTYLAFAAFFSALFIGCVLHYKKIVKNGVAGYPQEWFPSVSATIGDWYPERSIFQILIALNSGPRFALVFLQYHLQRTVSSTLANFLLAVGIVRTLSCGGWVYITSSDDHDWHDVLMITYIVCNIPWMYGGIQCTQDVRARRQRRIVANAFFGSIVPMIYFFVQHKVHRVPGAYTRYSFFEWALIILDVTYDSISKLDFEAANLEISLSAAGLSRNHDISVTPVGTLDASKPTEKPKARTVKVPTSKSALKSLAQGPPAPQKVSVRLFETSKLLKPLGNGVSFLCDVYLSYLNWSVFTSLIPTLFYFSVWQLGIAGSELALLSTLSPLVLAIPHAMDITSSRLGRTILYALTLLGPVAYTLKSPTQRLFVVAFANIACCIGWVVDWTAPTASRGYQATTFAFGLFMLSVAKHANHSNNPIWPFVHETSGGYNKTGILIAILAIHNFYSRFANPATHSSTAQKAGDKSSVASSPEASRKLWAVDGIALGSLIFSLHCFTTDSSTLIAWSWTGYPIKGPLPHLHGSLTHVAQALGILLPAILPDAVSTHVFAHPLWFLYGSLSAYVTYAYSDWTGYIGGWNLAVFLTSVIPAVLGRAASNRYAVKTYATAFFVAILFDLGSTFTVAYAFVIGGQYFRERTDLVMLTQMACLASAFRWPRIQPSAPTFTLSNKAQTYVVNSVFVLSSLSFLATMYRWPTEPPRPHRPGPRIIRAGIWTVHFGIDDEGRDSQRRMRDLIGDMELDIVGLLETDLHRIPYGNRDLTRVMLEDLGFHVDLGPGPNKHTWGAVLLSKYPILNSTHHLLPSPDGELAPAIHAVLDVYGTNVHVIVAHNGQEETPLDRELQATELARIMSSVDPEPLIFLGYVVTKTRAARPAPYDIMVTDGRVHDIDQDDFDRWCEYIFYRGLYRTSYARVSRSTITDTELQIGQFIVPKHGVGVTNDTEPSRYMRAWKEEMPKEHWFPQQYYREEGGMRGHYYHVFGTPLYYKIPVDAVL